MCTYGRWHLVSFGEFYLVFRENDEKLRMHPLKLEHCEAVEAFIAGTMSLSSFHASNVVYIIHTS